MEIGIAFKNLESYNEKMALSLKDKMFFLEHLPENQNYIFVDFGCADGTMINSLYEIYKNNRYCKTKFIGYDISDTMIDLARSKFDYSVDNVKFFTNWGDVAYELLGNNNYKKVLILSSVVHEVYSYAMDQRAIDVFWERVHQLNFDYVCVRDMLPSFDINRKTDVQLYKQLGYNIGLIPNGTKLLEDFESVWGGVDNNKNFAHFLLKYRYTVNWERELHENYFPIYVEDFIKKMCSYDKTCEYKVNYLERFRVPFLDKCIRDNFHLELEDYTHSKIIFERVKH